MGNIKKTLKYGANSVVLIAVVLVIAVLLNIILALLDFSFDLSGQKLFTITDITKNVVKSIPDNKTVNIYGLFDATKQKKDPNVNQLVELLKQYKKEAGSKINLTFVDPVTDPKFYADLGYNSEKLSADSDNKVMFIFASKEKSKNIYTNDIIAAYQEQTEGSETANTVYKNDSEQAFTGALKYVSSTDTPKIYFSGGNRETFKTENYKQFLYALDSNNFKLAQINLISAEKIPNDCRVLLFVSPQVDLNFRERELVTAYLEQGGSVFFVFDGATNNVKYPNIEKIMDRFGLSMNYDVVSETNPDLKLQNVSDGFIAGTQNIEINKDFSQQPVQVIFPRSFNIRINSVQGVLANALVKTSNSATSNTDSGNVKSAKNLLVASQRIYGDKTANVMALGTSKFFADGLDSTYASINIPYTVKLLGYLSNIQDENIVPPRSLATYDFTIEQTPGIVVIVLTTVALPLLILGFGLFVYLRRRHL